jgi:hypothetical protein
VVEIPERQAGTCAGRDALDAALTTVMTFSWGRVMTGQLLVGQAPGALPGEAPRS